MLVRCGDVTEFYNICVDAAEGPSFAEPVCDPPEVRVWES